MDQALATMKRMGFSYDLDRMVKTCSPDYYRWGQWIFEKLWEKGLVYRKKNPVNMVPHLQDRSGQRAGHRGQVLALRHRAREARP